MLSASPRTGVRVGGAIIPLLLSAILLLAVIATAWVGIRGALAYHHLRAAQSAVQTVQNTLTDPIAASGALAGIAADTAAAHALTSDPVWRVAEQLPWAGPQLAAVAAVATAIDDVAAAAITPLADVASTLSIDDLRPTGGRINLAPFTSLHAAATSGTAGIARAAASIDGIDRTPLVAPLRTAVDDVAVRLHEAGADTAALARATALAPAMLGADGPRNYLVLFQNNAEWRSRGGIPGAVALLHTDDGALSLVAQESSTDFDNYPSSVIALDPEVEAIYTQRPGRWIQNVTQVPDFAVSAALAREMWAREHGGQQVDGVLALDPVAVSYLLQATGPATLPSGDVLNADNAVPLLLNEVYQRYPDPAAQDAFFASSAATVFAALSDGRANAGALLTAFARAGEEQRLLLWSAHPEEQAELDGTTLAGRLPVTDAENARFGVYLNDGTGSKMDYYLKVASTAAWEQCSLDPAGTASGIARLTVTLTSNAPVDAAALPDYITGAGLFGVPAGVARTVGYLYLPEGFELLDASLSGGGGFGGGMHDGRRVLSFTVDLAPGESATASVAAMAPTGSAPKLLIEQTPTLSTSLVAAVDCVGG